ncbi:hypothetical protein DV735_g1080, partial [Chaetothyriales sp. CBS 134920]
MASKSKSNAGIHTAADGSSFIPASRRADGSIRKEIKVRPGFKPTEDIATYRTPTATTRSQLSTTVPGAEPVSSSAKPDTTSKNAKRREAARKRAAAATQDNEAETSNTTTPLSDTAEARADQRHLDASAPEDATSDAAEAEKQKKIRNALKKLKAVRDLKAKAAAGEKMSLDQLIKIGKEDELVRDLRKLDYNGVEIKEGVKD